MTTIKIKDTTKQARAVVEMLKTFSFVEIVTPTGLGRPTAKTQKVSKNVPNALTLKIMKETEEGKNLTKTSSHKDLMGKLFS